MPRKPKYSEKTDVVSIRLPLSMIDKLDEVCRDLEVGRGEFFINVINRYPETPSGKSIRIWLANLSLVLIGGGVALFGASLAGTDGLSPYLSPARNLRMGSPIVESYRPAENPSPSEAESGVPRPGLTLPTIMKDVRLDDGYGPGVLQYAIPRGTMEESQQAKEEAQPPMEEKAKD